MRLLIALSLLIPLYSKSQSSYDSLNKYCYLFYGKASDNSFFSGTGFFYRVHNKLFFLSASHCFTNRDIINCKQDDNPYPDTMSIVIGQNKFYPIDIRNIKKKSKCEPYYSKADIYVYQIKNNKLNVYSIENFVSFDTVKIEKVIVLGFNTHGKSSADSSYYIKIKSTNCIPSFTTNPYKTTYLIPLKLNDSINYQINTKGTPIAEGYSGSPVFFESSILSNGKTTNKIAFGGMVIAGNSSINLGTVVKAFSIIQAVLNK